ncbi:MAG: leucyl aminopeptidase [Armatimonadota bacterium]
MEIKIVTNQVEKHECSALIINLFEGVKIPGGATGVIDFELKGMISRLISEGEITGKLMETTLIHTDDLIEPDRVLVLGLGKQKDFGTTAIRKASGAAVRFLQGKGIKRIATIVHGAGIGGIDVRDASQALVEGSIIGAYDSGLYKTSNDTNEIESLTIVERDESKLPDIEAGISIGRIIADSVNNARTLGNEPSCVVTPEYLAEYIKPLAGYPNMEYEELDVCRLQEMGMNAIMSVGQGSINPPRLITLRYMVDAARPTIAFVGKAVTFDSGGLSIKPSAGMNEMKFDMAGGAAVIETMRVIGELKLDINVIGIIPAVENMPGGGAFRPGDVITCFNGKTVEITTTDAEGRLIMADALAYAVKQGANCIVDIATLTGGCVVALGNDITGVMGNNPKFMEIFKETAEVTGERVWELPLPADYKELLDSDIADMTNAGGRPAQAIQGGLFLNEFVYEVPWIHMDIGGTGDMSSAAGPKDRSKYVAMGASGIGVRTLSLLAERMSKCFDL